MTRPITPPDAAGRYADAGWPVHPLHDTARGHCSCTAGPDCRNPGKHPRTREGFHDATTDRGAVDRWWRRWPAANIGVPTGSRSRLAVIDLDGPAGAATWRNLTRDRNEPRTAQAATPHGRHYWYRLPNDLSVPRSIRGLGDGIDVLGDNGYAIAPPSQVIACPKPHSGDEQCSGGYAWTGATRHLEQFPTWVPERLAARRFKQHCQRRQPGERDRELTAPCERADVRNPRRYALAALRSEAARVTTARSGHRNDALNLAVWRLRRYLEQGTLTEDEIRTALAKACHRNGLIAEDGLRSVRATVASGMTAQ